MLALHFRSVYIDRQEKNFLKIKSSLSQFRFSLATLTFKYCLYLYITRFKNKKCITYLKRKKQQKYINSIESLFSTYGFI